MAGGNMNITVDLEIFLCFLRKLLTSTQRKRVYFLYEGGILS